MTPSDPYVIAWVVGISAAVVELRVKVGIIARQVSDLSNRRRVRARPRGGNGQSAGGVLRAFSLGLGALGAIWRAIYRLGG